MINTSELIITEIITNQLINPELNDWNWISKQPLNEDFIRGFKDKVNWKYISAYQILSEEFIEEFQDKVIWEYIFAYQKLSKEFMRKFENKLNWDVKI